MSDVLTFFVGVFPLALTVGLVLFLFLRVIPPQDRPPRPRRRRLFLTPRFTRQDRKNPLPRERSRQSRDDALTDCK
jgi:hypothetical protein